MIFNTGDKMKNTKTQEIKELVEAVKQVAEKKTYKVGDEVKAYGKSCKVVEVLDTDRYHVKNLIEPFDSFVVLENEINAEVQKDANAPDLMYREDNRFSL